MYLKDRVYAWVRCTRASPLATAEAFRTPLVYTTVSHIFEKDVDTDLYKVTRRFTRCLRSAPSRLSLATMEGMTYYDADITGPATP